MSLREEYLCFKQLAMMELFYFRAKLFLIKDFWSVFGQRHLSSPPQMFVLSGFSRLTFNRQQLPRPRQLGKVGCERLGRLLKFVLRNSYNDNHIIQMVIICFENSHQTS